MCAGKTFAGFPCAILISRRSGPFLLSAKRGKLQKEKTHPFGVSFLFGAGNEARTRFPVSREPPAAIRGSPPRPRIESRFARGGGSEFSPPRKKAGHPTWISCYPVSIHGNTFYTSSRSNREASGAAHGWKRRKVRPAYEKSPKAFSSP